MTQRSDGTDDGMLCDADVAALVEARHADPFAVLGLHADAHGVLWARALLPGAHAVAVLERDGGRRVANLTLRHADGLFEGVVPERRERFAYRLLVTWADGREQTLADAYAYGSLIDATEIYYLGEGSHLRPYTVLGAHAMEVDGVTGVRFALWAPNAQRASVVGDFNAWDARRHPMRVHHGVGLWEIFVPHVAPGDRYKYELRARDGAVLPLKADPYARACELRPATACVVAPLPPARCVNRPPLRCHSG